MEGNIEKDFLHGFAVHEVNTTRGHILLQRSEIEKITHKGNCLKFQGIQI